MDDAAMKKALFLQLKRRCVQRKTETEKKRGEGGAYACKCVLCEEKYRNEASRLRLYDTADRIVFA